MTIKIFMYAVLEDTRYKKRAVIGPLRQIETMEDGIILISAIKAEQRELAKRGIDFLEKHDECYIVKGIAYTRLFFVSDVNDPILKEDGWQLKSL